MIARALASESDASFLNVTLSTLEAKYYGETPKIIKAVFQVAKEKAPCILFFDEIDGIMRKRTEDEQSHTYGLKTEFLQALDNLLRNSTDAVFVIACTNHESALDKAVVRRFSNRYTMDLPSQEERFSILKTIVQKENTTDLNTIQSVAKSTTGKTGSDLKDMYTQACARRLERACDVGNVTIATQPEMLAKALGSLRYNDWIMEAKDPISYLEESDLEAELISEGLPPLS